MRTVNSYALYRGTTLFNSLNGLRCLSILAIIWHQTAGQLTQLSLLKHGHLGVTLLFVISGYLTTTSQLRKQEQYGSFSLRNFYLRQMLRIFPLYYGFLITIAFVILVTYQDTNYIRNFALNFPYFLTFTTHWSGTLHNDPLFFFATPLAIGAQYLLVWPIITKYTKDVPYVAVVLAIFCIIIDLLTPLIFGHPSRSTFSFVISTSISSSLLAGMLLAHLMHNNKTYTYAMLLFGLDWHNVFFSVLSIVAIYSYSFVSGTIFHPIGHLVVIIIFTCTLGSFLSRNDLRLQRVLCNPVISWIGIITYSMFVLQGVMVSWVGLALKPTTFAMGILHFLLSLVLTIAVGSISYKLLDSIFLSLKSLLPVSNKPRRRYPSNISHISQISQHSQITNLRKKY